MGRSFYFIIAFAPRETFAKVDMTTVDLYTCIIGLIIIGATAAFPK